MHGLIVFQRAESYSKGPEIIATLYRFRPRGCRCINSECISPDNDYGGASVIWVQLDHLLIKVGTNSRYRARIRLGQH
jgi:hypothetical protein